MAVNFLRISPTLVEIDDWEPGCWVQVVNPSPDEVRLLTERFEVPSGMINDISDNDERPRTEVDDDWQLIVLRVPSQTDDPQLPFVTVPLGVLTRGDVFVTLSFATSPMLNDFISHKQRKRIAIQGFFELLLRLIVSSAVWYSKYLKQINQQIRLAEKQLEISVRNSELQILHSLRKSLVFFVTSLKGNGLLLAKVKTSRLSKTPGNSEEIAELIEDAEIEIQQAQEMARIYTDILGGMADTYASVISNNLNQVVKRLTSISVVLMLPTLVASIYGMNVPNHLEHNPWSFFAIVGGSFFITLLMVLFFRRWDWL